MSKNNEFPNFIPKKPERYYKSNWVSWYDWLGNKKKCE